VRNYFQSHLQIAVVTGCEFARAEGREDEPLAALAWDLARIRSRLAGGDVTLLGLESLYRDCCELDAELKFLQPVPGSTVAQGKALRAFTREIQETRREIQAQIEEGEIDINVSKSRKMSAARAHKSLKPSKQKAGTAKRK
jgi:hypothetical protein